ncbi:NAD(P)-binding domain-containing protein [Lentimicrobium sp.]
MTGESFAHWYKNNPALQLKQNAASVEGVDLIINATRGDASLDVLASIGTDKLQGKIMLDIANPLDFSNGMPPTLFVSNTTSLAEQIQEKFPGLKVVKALNTMSASIMVHPESIAGDHNVFVCGNHEEAKNTTIDVLKSLGWKQKNILDLGDITAARGTEMLLPIWLRLWNTFGDVNFNFHIQRN